ncbi:helix-turn-helix domain-containing protein [Streptomyces sp. JJ38]|uniref:helix-turn-helix domain-containing protein n=1 Tax=Streptomyces sp. JJ38 TaxID=2738128 RepID=UPI00214AD5B5|nr:helix-turn-helix domain-containing protein [Streptomyces sp. JJ38]
MSVAAPDRAMPTTPMLYRVEDAMRVLSMGRTLIYEQIRRGRLRSVKQGRTRLIPLAAIEEYVALLEREARGGER